MTKQRCRPQLYINSGECAEAESHGVDRMLRNASILDSLRRELWLDWSRFWHDCRRKSSSLYLVGKDTGNLYRSRFLSRIFGESRTSFVFVLRHPLTSCFTLRPKSNATRWGKVHSSTVDGPPQLKLCGDLSQRLQFWIKGHRVAFADASRLERVVIFQLERLHMSPAEVLADLSVLLQNKEAGGGLMAATPPWPNFHSTSKTNALRPP